MEQKAKKFYEKAVNKGNVDAMFQIGQMHDSNSRSLGSVNEEKDAKNIAYAFILSNRLLAEFKDFSRSYGGEVNTVEGRASLLLKNC